MNTGHLWILIGNDDDGLSLFRKIAMDDTNHLENIAKGIKEAILSAGLEQNRVCLYQPSNSYVNNIKIAKSIVDDSVLWCEVSIVTNSGMTRFTLDIDDVVDLLIEDFI